MILKKTKIKDAPKKPNSSAITAKIKSFCDSGRNFNWVCEPKPTPLPVKRPEPTAIIAWVIL